MNVNDVLQCQITNYLNRERRVIPARTNWASSLAHPCERYLFYRRTAWEQAAPVSDYVQGLFLTGSILERDIERMMYDVGEGTMRIVGKETHTGRDGLLERYEISGRMDGLLQTKTGGGQWETLGPVDIKTCNPNIYPRLNTADDLNMYSWTAKYLAQIMLYSLAMNYERGYILLVNKTNLAELKLIEVLLDFVYAEQLLQKAARVNDAVRTNTPPAKINRPDVCNRCEFVAYCMPEIQTGAGFEILVDEEIEQAITRMHELDPARKEYEACKRLLDDRLVKGKDVMVGDYFVQWTESRCVRKPSPGGPYSAWRKKIEKLTGETSEE